MDDNDDGPQLCVCVCVCVWPYCTHLFVIVSVWSFLLRPDFRYETEDGMCTRFKTSFIWHLYLLYVHCRCCVHVPSESRVNQTLVVHAAKRCLLSGTNLKQIFTYINLVPLTAENRVRFQSVHVIFVVKKVALSICLPVLLFSPVIIIPPMIYTHLHLHVALSRWAKWRWLRAFQKAMFCTRPGSIG